MENTVIASSWIDPVEWLDGRAELQKDRLIPSSPSLWLIDTLDVDSGIAECFDRILSPQETAKAERFHQANHVLRYKVAHTVLRLLLAKSASLDPATLAFSTEHHCKPLLQMAAKTDIQFNLSYTENRILIGLNAAVPIGVDIEWIRRPIALQEMLGACFSAREIAFIDVDRPGMHHRFFTLWTRKEAILKLTGEGIGEHLPHFEVLDGVYRAEKRHIGGTPPEAAYLRSFSVGDAFIGCYASATAADQPAFYRV